MNIDTISRLAYSGKAPSSAMPYEWLLWYRLRDIYAEANDHEITKAEGAERKRDAVNSYQAEMELYDRSVLLWKRIEQAATRYAKERTVEAADSFYKAVYGMEPGLPDRLMLKKEN